MTAPITAQDMIQSPSPPSPEPVLEPVRPVVPESIIKDEMLQGLPLRPILTKIFQSVRPQYWHRRI